MRSATTAAFAATLAATLAVTLLALAAPRAAAAQETDAVQPMLAAGGGVMRYTPDGGTRHDDGFVTLRVASPLVPLDPRHALIEPSLGYAWYRTADTVRHHMLLTELAVQLHTGPGMLAPYLGAGGGFAFTRGDSVSAKRVHGHLTGTVAAGVRWRFARAWGLAGEARLRALGFFQGTTRELTIGLFQRLE